MIKPDASLQELIDKVHANTASEEELQLLLELLDQPMLMPYDEWLQGSQSPVSQALISKVIEAATGNSTPVIFRYMRRWLPYAAIVLIALGIFYWWPSHQPTYITVATKDGEIKRVMLPDSSVAILNARSSIRYKTGTGADGRQLQLNGEAFFDIHPDEHAPFIVQTGEVRTQVLGTSFNIKYFPAENLAVGVLTGKVKVVADEDKFIVLERGDKVILDHRTREFSSHTEDPQKMNAWQQGIINMDNLTLSEVATILDRWYSVKIILESPGIGHHRLSGSQANTSLESVLESICFVYHLSYAQEGNIIHIYKK